MPKRNGHCKVRIQRNGNGKHSSRVVIPRVGETYLFLGSPGTRKDGVGIIDGVQISCKRVVMKNRKIHCVLFDTVPTKLGENNELIMIKPSEFCFLRTRRE